MTVCMSIVAFAVDYINCFFCVLWMAVTKPSLLKGIILTISLAVCVAFLVLDI